MTTALKAFEIGTMDLSAASDFAEGDSKASRVKYIYNPGVYNVRINEIQLHASDKMKDGAGKQWGSVSILASDVDTGYAVRGFVPVPLETLVFTSKKNGSTSKTKTNIFRSFIQAVTGNRPALTDLKQTVLDLPNTLNGATFKAKVGYEGDYVNYRGKLDNGDLQFSITLRDGATMVDADGNEVITKTRDEIVSYFQNIKKYKPATTLSIVGFVRNNA